MQLHNLVTPKNPKPMKKIEIIAMMLATILCLCSTSCSDDKESRDTSANVTSSDPAGTIAANLRTDNSDFISLTEGDPFIYLDTRVGLNFFFRTATYNYYTDDDAYIVCVGAVKNISEIKTIPEAGWSHETAEEPGYGYVIKKNGSEGTVYVRVYVVDWITRTGDNGIIGVKIKYQVWEP